MSQASTAGMLHKNKSELLEGHRLAVALAGQEAIPLSTNVKMYSGLFGRTTAYLPSNILYFPAVPPSNPNTDDIPAFTYSSPAQFDLSK